MTSQLRFTNFHHHIIQQRLENRICIALCIFPFSIHYFGTVITSNRFVGGYMALIGDMARVGLFYAFLSYTMGCSHN